MGPAPDPVDERKRLEPRFVEWMMGFPAGWTEGMTRPQALKALGNAVVPQQALYAFEMLVRPTPDLPVRVEISRIGRTRKDANIPKGHASWCTYAVPFTRGRGVGKTEMARAQCSCGRG